MFFSASKDDIDIPVLSTYLLLSIPWPLKSPPAVSRMKMTSINGSIIYYSLDVDEPFPFFLLYDVAEDGTVDLVFSSPGPYHCDAVINVGCSLFIIVSGTIKESLVLLVLCVVLFTHQIHLSMKIILY